MTKAFLFMFLALPGLCAARAETPSVASEVDPFIGTALADARPSDQGFYNGNTFPGADYPMGMVQWSPDTPAAKGVKGGYWYPDRVITGFPVTHFSGRGVTYLQDFPLLPVARTIDAWPADGLRRFAAPFSHDHESARPGYYSVTLDNGIRVELTATPRSGMGRIKFPAGAPQSLILGGCTRVDIVGGREVTAHHTTSVGGGKHPYTLYLDLQFDRPSATSAAAPDGAVLRFDPAAGEPLRIKAGLSFVSIEGARANIAAENPAWDFDAVCRRADEAWNGELSRIRISGGDEAEQRVFYTALYHCFFHPNLLNDADGRYPGMDGRLHTVESGRCQYQNIPAWDQYRSFTPLRSILTPKAAADIAESLVNYARQDADARPSGGGLPRWEQANRNSGGMVGDGDDAIIAETYAFGARFFDARAALAAMEKGASVPGTTSDGVPVRGGLEDYLALGYVPRRASVTQEYCIADFALSRFAEAIGDHAAAAHYLDRSRKWRALFNPATGYLQPREQDGAFRAGFSPAAGTGFTEGSAAQYTWMVNFDFPGLFELMGGSDRAVARLDRFFTQLDGPGATDHAYMGNEPCEAAPWAYTFAGAPAGTQRVVRRIQRELFRATPGGLPGNDDAGAISSWFVFSALGLYPAVPGVAGFAIGSPLFPAATVALANGQTLRITTEGAGPDTPYVQALTLNGQPWNRPWIPWEALSGGATLHFTLGRQPSDWGTSR